MGIEYQVLYSFSFEGNWMGKKILYFDRNYISFFFAFQRNAEQNVFVLYC